MHAEGAAPGQFPPELGDVIPHRRYPTPRSGDVAPPYGPASPCSRSPEATRPSPGPAPSDPLDPDRLPVPDTCERPRVSLDRAEDVAGADEPALLGA